MENRDRQILDKILGETDIPLFREQIMNLLNQNPCERGVCVIIAKKRYREVILSKM